MHKKYYARLCGCALLLCLSLSVEAAETLKYKVQGLSRAQLENVSPWLGPAPTTEAERSNFLVSARDRVVNGLQALGYYHPEIDITVDKSKQPWQMSIEVAAGEPVIIALLDVSVSGAAAEDQEFNALLSKLPLAEGAVLHHGKYEAMKKSLLSLGQKRGYFDAQIAVSRVEVETATRRATVRLHYNSGQRYLFGEIRQDELTLFSKQVEALRPFAQGDPFSLSQLQNFQSQLQRTGYFSGVLVQPHVDQAEDFHVPLDVELFPAKRHSVEVGIGYSTDTEERLSLVWRTPLINRYGHSQETRLEYSAINPSGRFTYHIPLSHPLNDVLQLQARLEQNEFGDIDSKQQELGALREIRSGRWVSAYSLRHLSERWDLNGQSWDANYALPGFTLSHKQREGALVNPSRGLSQFYKIELGSDQAGSDMDLLRVYSKLVYVTTLPSERHRLVARLELGAVFASDSERDELAPSLNFFAGGSQSLRGYAYQSVGRELKQREADGSSRKLVVGGNRLLVGSLEYQYQFSSAWRGALFVDAGDAFDQEQFDANYGLGFGLHYLTPVGAIKLELASNVSDEDPSWRIHINIGAEF